MAASTTATAHSWRGLIRLSPCAVGRRGPGWRYARAARRPLGLLLLFLALETLLEVLDALAQTAAELGNAAGPEDQDDEKKYEQQLRQTETKHDALQGAGPRRCGLAMIPPTSHGVERKHAQRLVEAPATVAGGIDRGLSVAGGMHGGQDGGAQRIVEARHLGGRDLHARRIAEVADAQLTE